MENLENIICIISQLLRIQEERARDKEIQLVELEELQKSFEKQLLEHKETIRAELQFEFDQQKQILLDENENLLQKLSAAEDSYKITLNNESALLRTTRNEVSGNGLTNKLDSLEVSVFV